jgi:hypothetical protein
MACHYNWNWTCCLLLLLIPSASSFLMPTTAPSFLVDRLFSSINPNDFETPEQRETRMEMVRRIQDSYYLGKDEGLTQISSETPTLITEVPLLQAEWTELPGYQNILQIHVPHYTHMFRRILSGPRPWLFGHILSPGGNNQETRVGTLMQVSDYKQVKDGRLAMIVQGLERFQVVETTQIVPYGIANIELIETAERDNAVAVQENLKWRGWEFRPTSWKDMGSTSISSLSPLVNYNTDYSHFPKQPFEETTAAQAADEQIILKLELAIWISLDDMLQLIDKINPWLRPPLPVQLLGLLPTCMSWPEGFLLEATANEMETNADYVRVSQNQSYPPLRRAARLSYIIWFTLEAIGKSPTKQALLEETSTANRLVAALQKIDTVNKSLRSQMGLTK